MNAKESYREAHRELRRAASNNKESLSCPFVNYVSTSIFFQGASVPVEIEHGLMARIGGCTDFESIERVAAQILSRKILP